MTDWVFVPSSTDPPVIVPTSQVAAGGSAVASGSMEAVADGLQPPLPGMVRVRVAELEAGTGVVVSRTFPVVARTEFQEGTTQTDPLVFPFVFLPKGKWSF